MVDFRAQLDKPRKSPVQTNLIRATKDFGVDCKRGKIDLIYDHIKGDVQKVKKVTPSQTREAES